MQLCWTNAKYICTINTNGIKLWNMLSNEFTFPIQQIASKKVIDEILFSTMNWLISVIITLTCATVTTAAVDYNYK